MQWSERRGWCRVAVVVGGGRSHTTRLATHGQGTLD